MDVHAMRTTFGTLLSKSGVTPRTAQAAMRHSTINLTMNTYTDPKLLDVAGAVEALPELPMETGKGSLAEKATGTYNASGHDQFAPKYAPTSDKPRVLQSTAVPLSNLKPKDESAVTLAVSASPVNEKDSMTIAVTVAREVERIGVKTPYHSFDSFGPEGGFKCRESSQASKRRHRRCVRSADAGGIT